MKTGEKHWVFCISIDGWDLRGDTDTSWTLMNQVPSPKFVHGSCVSHLINYQKNCTEELFVN